MSAAGSTSLPKGKCSERTHTGCSSHGTKRIRGSCETFTNCPEEGGGPGRAGKKERDESGVKYGSEGKGMVHC